MKITNNDKGLQGVHTVSGVVYLKPGETRDVELSETGAKQTKRLPFLSIGKGGKEAEAPSDAKTPQEVLAMADDKDVPFMSFKSAASKLLGDKTPAKKDEIVLALMELATKP